MKLPYGAVQGVQGAGCEAVAYGGPEHLPNNQACLFQDLQVLGHRGLGKGKLIDNLPTDTRPSLGQKPQDPQAGRMA